MLTEAKRDADFFVANGGQIRRQPRIEVPPVVIRAALDGDLEQPIGDAFARASDMRDAAQQPGNVRNIAQLLGERRHERLFLQFHVRKCNTRVLSESRHGTQPVRQWERERAATLNAFTGCYFELDFFRVAEVFLKRRRLR